MNYYQARQRESDGRWAFTCRNDDNIWPVGWCARIDGCGHHDTADEARRCYARWLSEQPDYDSFVRGARGIPRIACGCDVEGCEMPGWHVRSGPTGQHLCPDHCNREGFAQALGEVHQIISSY